MTENCEQNLDQNSNVLLDAASNMLKTKTNDKEGWNLNACLRANDVLSQKDV